MITNYPSHETGGSEQNWCITQDHRGVIYVGNNEKGVLEYDGVQWRNIVTPGNVPVYSLVTGEDGIVYVGAENDFGLLEPDRNGELGFRSLSDSSARHSDTTFIVWKTYSHEKKTWFCTHGGIYVYDPLTEDIELIPIPGNAYHSYIVGGRLYNSNLEKGLTVYENGRFKPVPGGDYFHEMAITGLEYFDSESLLVSTLENGIFLLDYVKGELNDAFLNRELMEEFRRKQITCTRLLHEELLVCTSSQGLYVLDRSGRLKELISESEGLPDNTIIQVYTDGRINGSGPLWIAHRKGVSKIENHNPFRVFTESSGFENLITDIAHFDGRLYVSTWSGLYYKSSSSGSTNFKKITEIPGEVNDLHLFQPGRGRSMLLASTLSETYVIDRNMRVSSLKSNLSDFRGNTFDLEQIAGHCILNDPELANVIFTGFTRAVGLQYERGRWREVFRSDELKGEIRQMARDRFGYLWISTPDRVIRIDMELSPAFTMKDFGSGNGLPFDEDNKVFLNPLNSMLMVGTRNGFYRFNYFQERFVPDSLINSVLPPGANIIRTFHPDRDGNFWLSFENEHMGWTEMVARNSGEHLEVLFDKPFLRLSPAASANIFFSDPDSGVWFSKADELYHFDKTFIRKDSLPYQVLIRKVMINSDSVLFMGANFKSRGNGAYSLQASQDDDSKPHIKYRYKKLDFHWAAPYFEQEGRLQYSYILEGFSKSWSQWQQVPFKQFTNLGYGKYRLRLKARNIYGIESEESSYAFVILRPWYASFPAILGYILLSGLLVYLLVRKASTGVLISSPRDKEKDSE